MSEMSPEIVSIADACLGGLQGRSALLVGPEERRRPYLTLLRQARMKYIYEEESPQRIPHLLPYVQLLISMPEQSRAMMQGAEVHAAAMVTAANVARGCIGRHSPLLIFDLARVPSVEELAGLLPAVCLYTPDDFRHILHLEKMKAS